MSFFDIDEDQDANTEVKANENKYYLLAETIDRKIGKVPVAIKEQPIDYIAELPIVCEQIEVAVM